MTQIGKGTEIPIVHTVELLDWATGGPMPEILEGAGFGKRLGQPLTIAAE
jgi:glycolate oxidase iron-sulfur subunit